MASSNIAGTIYKITNKTNGHSYIGQTIGSVERRWQSHCSSSNCRVLHNAIQKYGKLGFNIKVLARCDSMEEMNHREQYYIKLFNTLVPNGYNLDSGGKNRVSSIETRERISKSLKGRRGKPCSDEKRNKISASHVGKKASKETKEKLSKMRKGRNLSENSTTALIKYLTGRPKSEEHKRNLSLSKKGRKMTQQHKDAISSGLKTPIRCNETGKIYISIKDAAIELGVTPSSIWHVLNGKCKTCKGLTFSYVKD